MENKMNKKAKIRLYSFFIVLTLFFFFLLYSIILNSNVTAEYKVIEISKAEHLDSNRNFISDIYNETKTFDSIWSEAVYSGEYVRVAFKINLIQGSDITVYVRNTQQENTKIGVYEENKEEKIAEFPVITDEGYYKVYLTNLIGEQNTFDLKIVNENNNSAYLEFDYILDPQEITAPYGVWLKSPPNNSIQTSLTVWFSANFTTSYNLQNATPWIWNSTLSLINDTQVQQVSGIANTSNVSIILPKDDIYYWNYFVCNASFACAFNLTNWSLTVDTTSPSLNLTYPLNTTYNINVSRLNYTVDSTATFCMYYNGTSNATISTCGVNITGLKSNEGSNTWIVYANDTSGNQNSSSVTFFKDTIFPLINLTYPLNNSRFSSVNNIILNYTVRDTNLQTCWYFAMTNTTNNYIISNTSITCGQNTTINFTSYGAFRLFIYANDSANNQNFSSAIISIPSPIYTDNPGGPASYSGYNESKICFKIYDFIVEHTDYIGLKYTLADLLMLRNNLQSIIGLQLSTETIEYYIINFNLKCSFTGLTKPLRKMKNLTDINIQVTKLDKNCTLNLELEGIFKFALPIQEIYVESANCNLVNILKWFLRYEKINEVLIINGIRVWWLFILAMAIFLYWLFTRPIKITKKEQEKSET